MSKSTPAERARKCFALATSTQHEGERAAAIERGMAIIARNGLDPDRFDIPGRETPKRTTGFAGFAGFTGGTFDSEVLRAAMDAMRDDLRRAAEAAARQQEEMLRASMSRRSMPELAAARLHDMGWKTVRTASGRWSITIGRVEFRDIAGEDLVRIAAEKLQEEARRQTQYAYYEYEPTYRTRRGR